MPHRDGTGPRGDGRKGLGLGPCARAASPGAARTLFAPGAERETPFPGSRGGSRARRGPGARKGRS